MTEKVGANFFHSTSNYIASCPAMPLDLFDATGLTINIKRILANTQKIAN